MGDKQQQIRISKTPSPSPSSSSSTTASIGNGLSSTSPAALSSSSQTRSDKRMSVMNMLKKKSDPTKRASVIADTLISTNITTSLEKIPMPPSSSNLSTSTPTPSSLSSPATKPEKGKHQASSTLANTSLSSLSNDKITSILQNSLFGGELVKCLIKVKKLHIKKKKKKPPEENYLLCLTIKRGEKCRVQRLKYAHGNFSITKNSRLNDLREVQLYEQNNVIGFSLLFDKSEYWATDSQQDRNEFLVSVLDIYQELFQCMPHTNINLNQLRRLEEEEKVMNAIDDITHSYRELLTHDEERELENLLNIYVGEDTELNLDQLMGKLTNQLIQLEEDNITDMMRSEPSVAGLLNALDSTSNQLSQFEQWIGHHSTLLEGMKSDIQKIGARNDYLEVARRNYTQLVVDLENKTKQNRAVGTSPRPQSTVVSSPAKTKSSK